MSCLGFCTPNDSRGCTMCVSTNGQFCERRWHLAIQLYRNATLVMRMTWSWVIESARFNWTKDKQTTPRLENFKSWRHLSGRRTDSLRLGCWRSQIRQHPGQEENPWWDPRGRGLSNEKNFALWRRRILRRTLDGGKDTPKLYAVKSQCLLQILAQNRTRHSMQFCPSSRVCGRLTVGAGAVFPF
jgi:hypothetical protein